MSPLLATQPEPPSWLRAAAALFLKLLEAESDRLMMSVFLKYVGSA